MHSGASSELTRSVSWKTTRVCPRWRTYDIIAKLRSDTRDDGQSGAYSLFMF